MRKVSLLLFILRYFISHDTTLEMMGDNDHLLVQRRLYLSGIRTTFDARAILDIFSKLSKAKVEVPGDAFSLPQVMWLIFFTAVSFIVLHNILVWFYSFRPPLPPPSQFPDDFMPPPAPPAPAPPPPPKDEWVPRSFDDVD